MTTFIGNIIGILVILGIIGAGAFMIFGAWCMARTPWGSHAPIMFYNGAGISAIPRDD